MGIADWVRVLLLSLVWGSAFFHIEIALQYSGPVTVVLARVAGAAATLVLYCLARGIRVVPDRGLLPEILIMAMLANVLPFTLIAAGQTQIPSGLTAILIAATPLFTVVAGHLWGRAETATPAKVTGVFIGIAGVAVLMGADALGGLSGSALGQIAVLAAAFSYALSAVYGRRFRDIAPAAIAAWMLTASSLMTAPLAFLSETPFDPLPPPSGLAALAALSLLSTAVAYLLYFRILASAGATNAMLVTFVQPPVAILLGMLFLGESLFPHQLAGLALIFAGLALVDGRVVRLVAGRV